MKRRAKHRRPQPEPLRGGPYPLTRTPAAQLLLNAHQPSAEVPPELAERDYEFPSVQLPVSRPLVDHTQLLDALADDDTQVLDMASVLDGELVDRTPQPAQHEGLTPVPVPSLPFLNAHPPRHASPAGSARPARFTDLELKILDRPVPADAPAEPSLAPAPEPYQPIRRDTRHPLVFSAFDDEFWEQIETTVRQTQAGPGGLRMSVDDAMAALYAHLGVVERRHRAWDAMVPWLYAGNLADASRPLPRRTPGAALAAIEASRRQLVAS